MMTFPRLFLFFKKKKWELRKLDEGRKKKKKNRADYTTDAC
jgi:hypothetical protein